MSEACEAALASPAPRSLRGDGAQILERMAFNLDTLPVEHFIAPACVIVPACPMAPACTVVTGGW